VKCLQASMEGFPASQARKASCNLFSRLNFVFVVTSISEVWVEETLREGSNRWKVPKLGGNLIVT